ncbi:MAG: DinB family protein [Bacteroidota bacterium]
MHTPYENESAPFYHGYINQVSEITIADALRSSRDEVKAFLEALTPEQWAFRYAPEKWSLKEMWVHVVDTERVMAYRALRVARGDQTALPGFDENAFAAESFGDSRSSESILEAYLAQRASTLLMFQHMDESAYTRMGTASGHPVSVRALAYIISGHERHHLLVARNRYISQF